MSVPLRKIIGNTTYILRIGVIESYYPDGRPRSIVLKSLSVLQQEDNDPNTQFMTVYVPESTTIPQNQSG